MSRNPGDWYDNYASPPHSTSMAGNRPPGNFPNQHQQNNQRNQARPASSTARDQKNSAQQAPNQGSDSTSNSEYENVHVYGKGNALCLSADKTRSQGLHTVRIEGASSTGPRDFNWSDKISLQFTIKELPFVLALFMGWIPKVQFVAHGPNNDKGFSLELQDGPKIFAKVWQKDRGIRSVPIPQSEIFQIVNLIIKQMLRNSPHLTSDSLLHMCRSVTRGYIPPPGGPSGGGGGYQNNRG